MAKSKSCMLIMCRGGRTCFKHYKNKKIKRSIFLWSGVNSSVNIKQRDIIISVYDCVHDQSDEVISVKKWFGTFT